MKKLPLLTLLFLIGCNASTENPPKPQPTLTQIEKTPELIQELKAQPTVDAQFGVLYKKFEPLLDRSDSLTGTDKNKNGIRDDIEAFIDALEVAEPVRSVLKQNAHYSQENLYHDWSAKTDANIEKAMVIGNKYSKVIACKKFLGMDVDDGINTGRTIRALTYNTKARTMAYLAYSHLQDGAVRTSLKAEAKYCE